MNSVFILTHLGIVNQITFALWIMSYGNVPRECDLSHWVTPLFMRHWAC